MKVLEDRYDVIVIGAGMGGLTAASLLANDGYSVLVLEAANVVGGCSSSYKRKGYIFESGATTLTGFDQYQPLRTLEDKLNIALPKKPIDPSMTVHLHGMKITRWRDKEKWITEAKKHFGENFAQESFWNLVFQVSDVIWKLSSANHFFPPTNWRDVRSLLNNDLKDLWILSHALKSVKDVARSSGISNPDFFKFLDEQLMISAQSVSGDTPFIFGAPAISYTNYTNYYVQGGLISMVSTLENFIVNKSGSIHTKEKVLNVDKSENYFLVKSSKGKVYTSDTVVSNIPIWNMADITHGKIAEYFRDESKKYDHAWGAFTMGIVTDDPYPEKMSHHHQVHFNEAELPEALQSGSLFVSFSERNDTQRASMGKRVLNVSAHTLPEFWFNLNGSYDSMKKHVQDKIVKLLAEKLPGFSKAEVKLVFSASPVTWSRWVYRKHGRVGGIPQSMMRSLFDWTPSKTPFDGLFLCGDTVFPGQGIPGVTLSGINVYLRVKQIFNHSRIH